MSADLIALSEAIAPSDLLPAAYRNKPANVLVAAHLGSRFGWDPATSCQLIDVVDGRPTLAGAAMLGLIRAAGHSVTLDHSDGVCVASGERSDNHDSHSVSFSRADAEKAGLAKRKNWQQYEADMLQWRAVSRLARALFSDVLLGVRYTPEELHSDDAGALLERTITARELQEAAEEPAEEHRDNGLMDPGVWKGTLLDQCGGNKTLARRIADSIAPGAAEENRPIPIDVFSTMLGKAGA